MRKRYDYIDLLKFIACIAIVSTHIFNLGIEWGSYPFSYGWIFVEFFLIITGYFTTLHFLPFAGTESIDQRMKRSLLYTKKKFVRLLPYTTVVILLEYVFGNLYLLRDNGFADYLKGFVNMPFEMAYLSCATSHTPKAATVWYISAIFLTFPVFCCLLQMKSRKWLLWLSFIIPVLYYCYFGVTAPRSYPHDLLRAFSCMMIGTGLCLMQKQLNGIYGRIKSRLLLTGIEVLFFAVPIFAAYSNSPEMMNLCLVCFMISISIMFSEKSYTTQIRLPMIQLISEYNIPLFLWNWTVATIIRCVWPGMDTGRKIVFFFVGSYLIPVVHMIIVRCIRQRKTLHS